jgi:LmbE family N-acetylglucosaminyl deacetylase
MPPEMHQWGAPVDLGPRPVVVSPHFDDAVLGAGQLLAAHPGATVITVLAGRPPNGYPPHVTQWDAWGGFGDGDDVVSARRREDEAALAVLRAGHAWLDFSDHQYVPRAERYRPEQVAGPLEAAIAGLEPTAVLVPFGLANPDHALTHDAARIVIARRPDLAWFCYEDHGYKHIPGMLAWRVSQLFRAGLWPTPAVIAVDPGLEAKRKALACYASQLPALAADWGFDADLAVPAPEQFWRLAPPPPGWERLIDAP